MAGQIGGNTSLSFIFALIELLYLLVLDSKQHVGWWCWRGSGCDRLSLGALPGSGPDGAEEIKRHVFYSTIDWNVSV